MRCESTPSCASYSSELTADIYDGVMKSSTPIREADCCQTRCYGERCGAPSRIIGQVFWVLRLLKVTSPAVNQRSLHFTKSQFSKAPNWPKKMRATNQMRWVSRSGTHGWERMKCFCGLCCVKETNLHNIHSLREINTSHNTLSHWAVHTQNVIQVTYWHFENIVGMTTGTSQNIEWFL